MKIRVGIAAIVVLAAVLGITNPSQNAHRTAVYTSVATEKTKSDVLGKIAVDLLGNREVLPLTYNNYFLFSTTTLNGKTASVGLFSRVWNLN
jgi:hypothetical protein